MTKSSPKSRRPSGSSPPRVLVVEANPSYRSVISHIVELAGSQFESAAEIDQYMGQFGGNARFDMIIVGTSATAPFTAEQVGKLRTEAHCPLIVLSEAYAETKDTLAIYKAGADEVLPKPFVPDALIGAIMAELRRPGPVSVVPLARRIEIGRLIFDSDLRRVTGKERHASFTKREWQLLTFLLTSPNQFFTAAELASKAWGPETSVEQFRSYVTRLRHKLSPFSPYCAVITEKGKGYCLAIEQAVATGS